MHSFVTGNTGFIGSVLVDCLLLVQAVATDLLSTEIVSLVAQLGLHYSLDALYQIPMISTHEPSRAGRST